MEIEGYEIHMGISERRDTVLADGQECYEDGLLVLRDGASQGDRKEDGMCTDHIYGCYVHGIFDQARVTEVMVRALLRQKGYAGGHVKAVDMREYKEEQYDKLAQIIRENIDMEAVYRIIGAERNQ